MFFVWRLFGFFQDTSRKKIPNQMSIQRILNCQWCDNVLVFREAVKALLTATDTVVIKPQMAWDENSANKNKKNITTILNWNISVQFICHPKKEKPSHSIRLHKIQFTNGACVFSSTSFSFFIMLPKPHCLELPQNRQKWTRNKIKKKTSNKDAKRNTKNERLIFLQGFLRRCPQPAFVRMTRSVEHCLAFSIYWLRSVSNLMLRQQRQRFFNQD